MNQFLELKEFFVGGRLFQPQTSWLCPVEEPFIEIGGEVPTGDNVTASLDFGSVSPLEPVHQWLDIANLTQYPMMVWIKEYHNSVSLQWENGCDEIILPGFGGKGKLKVTFNGGDVKEQILDLPIILVAEMDSGSGKEIVINAHIHVIIDFPYGHFSFNNKASLAPCHFGRIDPTDTTTPPMTPYVLSIENVGRESMSCQLGQVPPWLNMYVNNRQLESTTASFQVKAGQTAAVTFLPGAGLEFLGTQKCKVPFTCNDIRPAYRDMTFEFSVLQEIEKAYVRLVEPVLLETVAGNSLEFKIPLKNLGNTMAHITPVKKKCPFHVKDNVVIPMVENNTPHTMDMPVILDTTGLTPGKKRLEMELSVPESHRKQLVIPIEVSIIGIKPEPDEIDFAEVDPVMGAVKTVCFNVSDGRTINIMARPVKDVANYLKVIPTDSNAFDVHIAQNISQSVPPPSHYEGPGIEVFEPDMNYRTLLPVKFRFGKPKAGKLCGQCLLVSDPEVPFCSGCGSTIKDAVMISEEVVSICPECGRKYSSELPYCRVDGKKLLAVNNE